MSNVTAVADSLPPGFFDIPFTQSHFGVASSFLVVYDAVLTFPREVRCIWMRRFSGATVIYILVRYSGLALALLDIQQDVSWNVPQTDTSCLAGSDSVFIISIINYISLLLFMVLRVYGIWGCDWKPLVFVTPLALLKPAIFIAQFTYETQVKAVPLVGCVLFVNKDWDWYLRFSAVDTKVVFSISDVMMNVILLVTTWFKTYGIYKRASSIGGGTPLASFLLIDGEFRTIYCVILAFFQVTPFMILGTVSYGGGGLQMFVWIMGTFNPTVTVICYSRFMLDLRNLYYSDRDDYDTKFNASVEHQTHSTVRSLLFAVNSTVTGNIGAALTPFGGAGEEYDTTTPLVSAEHEDNGDSEGCRIEGEDVFGAGVLAAEERREWYDEEPLAFARDPFGEGLRRGMRTQR